MRTLTLLLCVLLLCVIPAFAQQYDLLLKGGHVIDPKNDVNAVRDVVWRARRHDLAAGVAALWTEIYDPVGGADDVEVVLDHDERVPGGEQLAERLEQLRDVIEVQSGRRLIEKKK